MTSDQERPRLLVHAYGVGKRPPGKGSAIAWVEIYGGKSFVKWIDNLGPHQAAYRAVLSALRHAPEGAIVRIFCNSRMVFKVFCRGWTYDQLAGFAEAVET